MPVFVLVTVIVGFSVLEFRMRPGEENLDGPPIHGNTRLEVIWTAIPAILIVGLVTYAYVVMRDIEQAPAAGNERVVAVTGQQFTWTFAYNEGGKKFTTAQLYLPAGKSVKFDVRSKDVIHDFWVPDFRMKIDAVPGITTHYRVTPKNPAAIGDHAIVCAELCGLGHAFMRQTAHILAPADVRQVGAEDDRPPAAGGGGGGGGGAGRGRQGALHRRRRRHRRHGLRHLPHAGRRGRQGPGRSGPRQGAQGQGRGLHQGVDPRSPTR